mmetsp:Transcript_17020/g.37021  ORF Transcript_17020/g.37021 Transcript_17020/m.37021 type:complete len:216 (-) Transcript_17020:256-903(-)
MGTAVAMTRSPMTTPANLFLLAAVSLLVLKLPPVAFSALLGPPGSSLPSRIAWMRSTEEMMASLYFSSLVRIGMFSVTMPSTTSSPMVPMKAGPPTRAPSLEEVLTSSTPTLSPSSAVGNQFSITWSAKAKTSGSKTSLRTVTTSSLKPVDFSTFCSFFTSVPEDAFDSTPASSTMPAAGAGVLMMSNSLATAASMGASAKEAARPRAASPLPIF